MLRLKLQYFGHLIWRANLLEKRLMLWKDWRQEEKGTTEGELVKWCHRLNGHEFEQPLGDCEGQGSLMCYSPWDFKESDMTEWLNNFMEVLLPEPNLGSLTQHTAKPIYWQEIVVKKIRIYYRVPSKENDQPMLKRSILPNGFQETLLKVNIRGVGCKVFDQFMDMILTCWWWGNREIFQESQPSTFWFWFQLILVLCACDQ